MRSGRSAPVLLLSQAGVSPRGGEAICKSRISPAAAAIDRFSSLAVWAESRWPPLSCRALVAAEATGVGRTRRRCDSGFVNAGASRARSRSPAPPVLLAICEACDRLRAKTVFVRSRVWATDSGTRRPFALPDLEVDRRSAWAGVGRCGVVRRERVWEHVEADGERPGHHARRWKRWGLTR